MRFLEDTVSFLLSLGAAVFVPIIVILIGMTVRMKVKEALSAGLTLGVAFTGMTMLINFMTESITPAAKAMAKTTGVALPVTDGGWTTMATISWSWPWAFIMFPVAVGINIALILLKQTDTFNADLWNFWGKLFTAIAVYYLTGSVWFAFVVAAVQVVLELKAADFHQHRVEKLSGIPGVTITHRMIFLGAPMYLLEGLLRCIPGLKRSFDAKDLKGKIGIFAENHVLGFLMGIIFGVLARFSVSKTLMLGVQSATALVLFPVISKYFMQALEPISSAISEYSRKKFSGRQLFVGLDWPFLGGAAEIWIAVIWTIPITLLEAFLLPGNKILPFAGIINIAVAVPAYFVCEGNIIRMLIQCTIFSPVFLYVGSAFASLMTELANTTHAVSLASGQLISSSCIDAPVFTFAISHFPKMMSGDFVPLLILIGWFGSFVLYSRSLIREEGRDIKAKLS
ncbi:PTS galactitol transporter subunit IIC [Cutibacterium modestum]|mgnify:FL=1|uniref:PTS galactitol transporter subunit IIC n=1 Tax=Cutibacterium modestum TaxID=2559073 RepID=UPI0020A4E1B1|nr:PTS transporter subunit IIC [Cutibacterium modestum]MCP2378755.1 PTS system galactitol-specific transporter subunit IIC [Cutibacterium modestum 31N]